MGRLIAAPRKYLAFVLTQLQVFRLAFAPFVRKVTICNHVSAAYRCAHDYRRADQHDILDDILPFKRQRIWEYLEGFIGEDD